MVRNNRKAFRPIFARLIGVSAKRGLVHLMLLGAFTLDTLLFGLAVSFLPGDLLARGATSFEVGGVFAAYALGLLLATFPAGWLTDQIGARQVLLAGLLALLLSTLLFAFVPGIFWLFLARALQGVSGSITWTAGLALISQLSTEEERPRLFARIFVASSLGSLLGPPLGGILYSWGGFKLPFLVAAGMVLLDGLGRVLFLPGQGAVPLVRPQAGATRTLLRHWEVLLALSVTLVGTALFAALDPVLPLLLSGQFGLQSRTIGILFGALVVSFAAMQPLATRLMRRWRLAPLMEVGLLGSGLALLVLGLAQSLLLLTGALILLMCASAFSLIPALELLTLSRQKMTVASGVAYGAIYALYNLAFAGGTLLGPILGSGLTAWAGFQTGMIWLGVLPLVLAVGMWWAWRVRGPHSRVPR